MSNGAPDSKPWVEYRELVLRELERIARDIEGLARQLQEFRVDELARIKTDIALLKFQAALWGFAGGTLVTILVSLLPRLIKW